MFTTPAVPQVPSLEGELDGRGNRVCLCPAIVDVKTLDTSDTKARPDTSAELGGLLGLNVCSPVQERDGAWISVYAEL